MSVCSSPTISEPKGFSVCLWETDVYLRLIYGNHVKFPERSLLLADKMHWIMQNLEVKIYVVQKF